MCLATPRRWWALLLHCHYMKYKIMNTQSLTNRQMAV
jgi:hypothetical protein